MAKGSRKSGGKRADVLASRKPIVEEIVRLMEQGDLGWTEPVAGAMAPHNPVSGCRYRGANRLRLVWEAGKRGWGDSRFVTFNQAKAEGWHVRKGERGVMLEVWKDVPRKVSAEEGGEEEGCEWRPRLCCVGSFTVFNAAQVEGIPELHDEPPADSGLEGICETVKAAAPCPVREEGVSGEAYYAPARDEIRIFDRRCAVSLNMFVRVLLHEEIHSTGHVTRLGRFADGACALFGTEDYAREELVAELGAAFLAAELGLPKSSEHAGATIDHAVQHASYLSSWASLLKEDGNALFVAAAQADSAADMIARAWRG